MYCSRKELGVCDYINEVRDKTVDECINAVKEYFVEIIENNPEWEVDSIDDFALIPNKNICERLRRLKEYKNE